MEPQKDRELVISEFENAILSSVQAQQSRSSTPNATILKYLAQKAQQRGLKQPSETNGIAVSFTIELSDDELANIPIPTFFIGDRVSWSPLPGDEEPLEGGCVIGMKYWTPNFSESSVSLDDVKAEWQYLIYLNRKAPSRAWVRTDWGAESDLTFQEPCDSTSPGTEQEGTNLEP